MKPVYLKIPLPGDHEALFNLNQITSFMVIMEEGAGASVYGTLYNGGNYENVILKEGFSSKDEGRTWLNAKLVEWGAVIVDPAGDEVAPAEE
ncbi:MAG TPA: hypothetical protein ENN44_04560 [Methanoculleus sp.]|nr:hypothetical protein [Methanoculleus sp.]